MSDVHLAIVSGSRLLAVRQEMLYGSRGLYPAIVSMCIILLLECLFDIEDTSMLVGQRASQKIVDVF